MNALRWAPGPPPHRQRSQANVCGEHLEADLCIVGAGLSGMTLALEGARRGLDVVVVDSGRAGAGGTGASGGQLVVGTAPDIRLVASQLGDGAARRLWNLSVDGLSYLVELLQGHPTQCSLTRGHLLVVESGAALASLSDEAAYWKNNCAFDSASVLSTQQLRSHLDSPAYVGGSLDQMSGHLEPGELTDHLKAALDNAGVRLLDGRAVSSVDSSTGVVSFDAGSIRAEHVAILTGPWIPSLVPSMAPYIGALYAYAARLAPRDGVPIDELLPSRCAVADYRRVVTYFRPTGSALDMGFPSTSIGHDPEKMCRRIPAKANRLFPHAGPWRLVDTRRGAFCVTRLGVPICGRNGRVLWAGGYSGQGLVWAATMGRILADAITSTSAEFEFIASLRHRRFAPTGRLTAAALAGTSIVERGTDALGRR